MRKVWLMQSTPLMLSVPGPLWSGVVAPIGQIELNDVLMLSYIVWNRTVFDI